MLGHLFISLSPLLQLSPAQQTLNGSWLLRPQIFTTRRLWSGSAASCFGEKKKKPKPGRGGNHEVLFSHLLLLICKGLQTHMTYLYSDSEKACTANACWVMKWQSSKIFYFLSACIQLSTVVVLKDMLLLWALAGASQGSLAAIWLYLQWLSLPVTSRWCPGWYPVVQKSPSG